MTRSSSSPAYPRARKARPLRWALLLLASVVLHLIAFNWADGHIGLPSFHEQSPTVITTSLHSVAPPAPKAPPRKPRRRPAPPPPAAPPPAPEPVAQEPVPSAPEALEPAAPAVEPATAVAADETADADAVAAAPGSDVEAEPEDQAARYQVDPPPPVELKYDVMAQQQGQTYHGSGKLAWQSEGNSYTVTGEASLLFFSLLNFKSEGMIDDFGVAPVIYSEKRFRKPETNTHFHRERNTISFSASTLSYPRKGGEQDRASIVWQLAAIGRADSAAFAPDAEISLFVAGVRDGETWHIRVIGEEEVDTGAGKVNAWHVVRVPRPGSYDQQLDIWFAPRQEWYPVKLRYTEKNGDFLDMSLSNVHLLTAQ